jgi:8-oxo-dGTP pyrophosphatase MutT (NUDIX family)
MKKLHWKTLRSKTIHQNPWYRILEDDVIRPDGKKGKYFVIQTRAPSVFIVAVNKRREICLVKMHRYPTQMVSLEIPAGNSDGEPLLKAAKRELFEETGLRAKRWKKMGVWQPMNGLLREMSHVFLAADLIQAKSNDACEEGITEVRFYPYKKILRMIRDGKITDGQSIAGIYLAAGKLGWIKGV